MRIALLADSHLSQRSPECVANWHAARRAIERLAPDLTVHLGDVSLDGQNHPEELRFASELVRRWPSRILCVPGNHDIGDGSGEEVVEPALLASYVELFGADRWCLDAGGWRLVGINAQLLGSATPQEEEQWRWLDGLAGDAAAPGRTVLFSHRPVAHVEHDPKRSGRYVAPSSGERLLQGPLQRTLRAVVSGHTHQYLDRDLAGVRHVWLPSSGFVLPDAMQARVGEKLVGIGVLELQPEELRFDLWCPDGMRRHDLSGLGFLAALVDGERALT